MAEINGQLPLSLLKSTAGFRKLYQNMPITRREKSQIIIYEGDEVKQFYYLRSGYVKVYNINTDGEERVLMLRGPGDIFPLLKDPASPKYVSPYFYDTITDAEIGTIKQADFLAEAASSRESAWALLRYISEFSGLLTQRLEQIENKTAEGKLENLLPYLIRICGKSDGNGGSRLNLRLTHQDLASMLGIARETVSREMKVLTKKGIISSRGGYISISKIPEPR